MKNIVIATAAFLIGDATAVYRANRKIKKFNADRAREIEVLKLNLETITEVARKLEAGVPRGEIAAEFEERTAFTRIIRDGF